MFYNHADAQGIMIMVNTKPTTSDHAPPNITITTTIPSPTPVIEVLTPTPKVDKLASAITSLLVGE